MSQNIILISDTMIKERTSIHGNIDPELIYMDIKVAQDMYILPLLGTALYEKLQTLIDTATIDDAPNAKYKLLIDRLIVDALMFYTLSELPTTISFQFWNKGVVRKVGEQTETPSMSDLIDLSNKYKNRAEFYAERLRKYLLEKANADYPEYLNPGNAADTMNPSGKAFTIPIYLGDDDSYCNPGGFNGKPYSD